MMRRTRKDCYLQYLNKGMNEMRQPRYAYGIQKGDSGARITGRHPHAHAVHSSLWPDKDGTVNLHLRSTFLQRERNALLGVAHSENDAFDYEKRANGHGAYNAYEMTNPFFFKGAMAPALTDAVIRGNETHWLQPVYNPDAHVTSLQTSVQDLSPARWTMTREHAMYWWRSVSDAISMHYEAVGLGTVLPKAEGGTPVEYVRDARYVFEAFQRLDDAVLSGSFQDGYLAEMLLETRPPHLTDLFGILLEIEGNRVHPDYCPRCSLSFEGSKYCGQGGSSGGASPHRAHQGIWVGHPPWTKQWYEVASNHAEALFQKATEHPIFRTEYPTQRQVDALMRVYERCGMRGRANGFMAQVLRSTAFTLGHIQKSSGLMQSYQAVLDRTPHPILLTNGYQVQSGVQKYSGSDATSGAHHVPHSAHRLRIDLELDRFRREQREEGVVRIPPPGYHLNLDLVKDYRVDSNGYVENWREVKESLEQSFLHTRLPDDSYIEKHVDEQSGTETVLSYDMLRELQFWTHKVAEKSHPDRQLALEKEREADRAAIPAVHRFTFPDAGGYQTFHTDPAVIAEAGFPSWKHGDHFRGTRLTFLDPSRIRYMNHWYDIRDEFCATFGFLYGTRFEIRSDSIETDKKQAGEEVDIVLNTATCCGARHTGRISTLCAFTDDGEVIPLGVTLQQVTHFLKVNHWRVVPDRSPSTLGQRTTVPWIEKERTAVEECQGYVVGVRGGNVWWSPSLPQPGVAEPMGVSEKQSWLTLEKLPRHVDPTDQQVKKTIPQPASWNIPFRNDWCEEQLRDALRAPWNRQPYATLIPGRLTPKRKRFGYLQHITQDDFMTKEYHNRLVSKQFHCKPEAFTVIPDVVEKAPSLDGKWAHTHTNGIPTVDRKELDRGWSDVEDVPDAEVAAIEQAIRDISGTRPGNFHRRDSERAQFHPNESWWNFDPMWAHQNRIEMLKPLSERNLIHPGKLPFKGQIPVVGTAAGMGERFAYILEQLSSRFGIGPQGRTPSQCSALPVEAAAERLVASRLGNGEVLLRLFDQACAARNLTHAAFVYSYGGQRPKELMMSLHEWTQKGKAPSPLLREALGEFLHEELKAYNQHRPKGVPPLYVQGNGLEHASDASSGVCGTLPSNLWLEQDSVEFGELRKNETLQEVDGDAELMAAEGFVCYKFVEQHIHKDASRGRDRKGAVHVDDEVLEKWCRQTYADEFSRRLAPYVNRNVSSGFLAAVKTSREGFLNELRTKNQWITKRSLREFLLSLSLHSDDITYILDQAPKMEHTINHLRQTRSRISNTAAAAGKDKHSLLRFMSPETPVASTSNRVSTPREQASDKGEAKSATEVQGEEKILYHIGALLTWTGTRTVQSRAEQKQLHVAVPHSETSGSTAPPAGPTGAAPTVLDPAKSTVTRRNLLDSILRGTGAKFRSTTTALESTTTASLSAPSNIHRSDGGVELPMTRVLLLVPFVLGDARHLDEQYRIRENKKNRGLLREFSRLVRPLVVANGETGGMAKKVTPPGGQEPQTGTENAAVETALAHLFEDYCSGLWVPSTDETLYMLEHFIAAAATADSPERSMLRFRSVAGQDRVYDIQMAPTENLPFEFENVAHEKHYTIEHFRALCLSIGPEWEGWNPSAATHASSSHNAATGGTTPAPPVHVVNRPDVVPYRTLFASEGNLPLDPNAPKHLGIRGLCGYGERGNTVNNLTGSLFQQNLTRRLEALELDGSFHSLLQSPTQLRSFVYRVLQRHLPLLQHFYKLKESVQSLFVERKNQNETEMQNLRAVFQIKDKDVSRNVPYLFVDDVATFRVNPERYWRDLLRSPHARVATAHHTVTRTGFQAARGAHDVTGHRSSIGLPTNEQDRVAASTAAGSPGTEGSSNPTGQSTRRTQRGVFQFHNQQKHTGSTSPSSPSREPTTLSQSVVAPATRQTVDAPTLAPKSPSGRGLGLFSLRTSSLFRKDRTGKDVKPTHDTKQARESPGSEQSPRSDSNPAIPPREPSQTPADQPSVAAVQPGVGTPRSGLAHGVARASTSGLQSRHRGRNVAPPTPRSGGRGSEG